MFMSKTAPWRSSLLFVVTAALVIAPITGALGEERQLEIGKWYPTLEAGLALTQSAYSDNWAGGDKGSVVWTAILNSTLENQLNKKINSSSTLKLAFGQTHQQRGNREWDKPEKSTDLIQFETIFRFTVGWYVDPYTSGRFDSQFFDVSDPDGRSLSLNPIVVKEAAGFARQFINEEDRNLLTRVGFALRQTNRRLFIAPAPRGRTESEFTNDGGVEWVTDYKTKVLEDRVAWTSKLTLYQPVFYSEKSTLEDLTAEQLSTAGVDLDVADFTTMVDVDWENIFTTQITKILSVNLYVRWIYDKYDNSVPPKLDENGDLANPADVGAAIRKAGQFKQTMAIGLTYRFL